MEYESSNTTNFQFMSIENPTLAHFRHFSTLFNNLPSTSVENALQIRFFMQNKPNSPIVHLNVNLFNTKDYENLWLHKSLKTNPIQTQSKPILGKYQGWQTQFKPNSNPILKNFDTLDNYTCGCYNEISKVFLVVKLISKRNKMVKSISFLVFKVVVAVIVFVFVLLPSGCRSYEQMGETASEGRRRHLRNRRIDQQLLMADLDTFWLVDKPSRLTDKRIP